MSPVPCAGKRWCGHMVVTESSRTHHEPAADRRSLDGALAEQRAGVDRLAFEQIVGPGVGDALSGPLEIAFGHVPEGAEKVLDRARRRPPVHHRVEPTRAPRNEATIT